MVPGCRRSKRTRGACAVLSVEFLVREWPGKEAGMETRMNLRSAFCILRCAFCALRGRKRGQDGVFRR